MSAVPISTDIEPGVYPDISNEDYHGGPGISNSGLGDILRSPWHYYSRHLDPNRPKPTEKDWQLVGNLAHCAILEPEEFEKRYVVLPSDAPRRPSEIQRNAKKPSAATIQAIEWWDEWTARTAGATTITPEQRDAALRQSAAVRALPDVAEALASGRSEVSAYWVDDATDALCKCRPDWVHTAGAGVVLLDVKTTEDASPAGFARSIMRYGYHRQAAWYSDGYALASGTRVLAFVLVAVEKEWPYAACAMMLDDASLDLGRRSYRRALDTYAECLARNEWPSYSSAIELVSLPAYAFGE